MMTVACYKGGNSIMTSLIIMKIRLLSHLLNQMLDYVLDHIIIDFVTMVLHNAINASIKQKKTFNTKDQ